MQRCPSERVGSVLKPTMGFEGFRILEAAIRKVPSPPAKCKHGSTLLVHTVKVAKKGLAFVARAVRVH